MTKENFDFYKSIIESDTFKEFNLIMLLKLKNIKYNVQNYLFNSNLNEQTMPLDNFNVYNNKLGQRVSSSNFNINKYEDKIRYLNYCNKMLKKELTTADKESSSVSTRKNYTNNFLDIVINNRKKYLPNKYLYSENLYKDSDIQTIYYGKCALYIISPNNTNDTNNTNDINNKNNQKYYYLKVLNSYTKKEICEISITKNIYGYLSSDLENIPNKKDEAIDYYICFSGFLKKKQRQYKGNNYDFHQCNLRDSRLLILEKA